MTTLTPVEVEQEERFCARLHAWDRHVDGCPTCLAGGVRLCAEGQEIHDSVVAARWSSVPQETLQLPAMPQFGPSMFRRAWIGWVAFIAPLTG